MISIKFDVLGKQWEMRVLNEKKYSRKKIRNNSLGITYAWKRRIDLTHEVLTVSDDISKETICHELWHAYCAELCLDSTNKIKMADWEEIQAEFMAKRGREYLDKVDWLLEQIKEEYEKAASTR